MRRGDGLNGTGARSQLLAIEAIGVVTAVALDRGHRLGGFSRRSSQNGYRFVARCRGCGHEVTVGANGSNGRTLQLPVCPQTGAHRHPGTLAAEDFLLAEIAELIDAARRSTAVQDRIAALTQVERLSAWALRQFEQGGPAAEPPAGG